MPATPPSRLTGQKGGLSLYDGLANPMSGAGGSADKRSYDFYQPNFMTREQVETAYRSSWLVRKVHDLPPGDMTRAWRDWQADKADITALEKAERTLAVRGKTKKALALARLQGGGALFMGFGDDASKPLPENVAKGGMKYLTVLSRWHLTYDELDQEVLSPYFGQPKMWQMVGGSRNLIHPSRIVPFVGQPLPEGSTGASFMGSDRFWGDPLLQSIWSATTNADLAQSSIASIIDEASIDVIGIPGLMDMVGTAEGEKRLMRRLEIAKLGKSIHRALVKDALETWEQKEQTFTGLPDLLRLFLLIASGASDIPATRLLGQAPQGMNATGDGDMDNYLMMLEGRQVDDLQPCLDRLDEALIPSALGSKPDDVTWTFAPLKTESEAVKATIELNRAQAVQIYANVGALPGDALATVTQNRMIESGEWPGLEDALAEAKLDADLESVDPGPEGDPSALPGDPANPATKPPAVGDAFNPDEPRDPNGEWSGGGVTGSAAHSAAARDTTATQDEALKNYSGGMFRDVNPRLRAGQPVKAADKEDLRQMDDAFSSQSTSEPITVYRGVSGGVLDQMQVGSEFTDGGFVSTSSSRTGADNFVRGDKSALMEIHVPQGSPAMSIKDLSAFGRTEQEILLNRGGTFRVTGRTEATMTRPTKIVVEYHGR